MNIFVFQRNSRKWRVERDFFSKRTNEGVHRSDLLVNEKNKKIEAKKCSTGEQKSLLMGIILSHLELVSSFKSRYPVLLLDEVLAHFDKIRRKSFFKHFKIQLSINYSLIHSKLQIESY